MIEIGGKPILWHVMMIYAHYGFKDFIIALGYKGEMIQEYFSPQKKESKKIDKNSRSTKEKILNRRSDWTVEFSDTGISTQTGGRIKRLAPYLDKETFMLSWCDGVSDINLHDLLSFHRSHGKLATVTAVHFRERFGLLKLQGDRVEQYVEKPLIFNKWISGAFFVLEPGIFDYIDGDDMQWEKEPLERLAQNGQLMAYRHTTFWQCMDEIHEQQMLEELWHGGSAPWKVWE
jgi:glucose-1-phosphate cytidylyltransferase